MVRIEKIVVAKISETIFEDKKIGTCVISFWVSVQAMYYR